MFPEVLVTTYFLNTIEKDTGFIGKLSLCF